MTTKRKRVRVLLPKGAGRLGRSGFLLCEPTGLRARYGCLWRFVFWFQKEDEAHAALEERTAAGKSGAIFFLAYENLVLISDDDGSVVQDNAIPTKWPLPFYRAMTTSEGIRRMTRGGQTVDIVSRGDDDLFEIRREPDWGWRLFHRPSGLEVARRRRVRQELVVLARCLMLLPCPWWLVDADVISRMHPEAFAKARAFRDLPMEALLDEALALWTPTKTS